MRRGAIVMALVAGCSGGAADLPSYSASVIHLICQHQVDCGFLDPAYESACEQALNGLGTVDMSKIHYDATAGQACLDAVAAALKSDCTYASVQLTGTAYQSTKCEGVVTGTAATGESCRSSTECVPGDVCSFQFMGNMCMASCQPASTTSPMPGDVGAACMSSSSACKVGLTCVPNPDYKAGTCGAPPTGGAACFGSAFDSRRGCASGLACDVTAAMPTCIAEKKQGEACNSADQCAARLFCLGLTSSPPQPGTCQPPLHAGDACTPMQSGGPCIAPFQCLGTCVAPPRLGESCAGMTKSCLDGWCNPGSQKCEALLALGATCDPTVSGPQCAALATCDAMTKLCRNFCM